MKSSTKDKIQGETEKLGGKVKEGLGKLTGNSDLEEEGQDDQLKGEARKKLGDIKKVFDQ